MSTRRILAVFGGEREILEATRAVREDGYFIVDVHTPYAVHGLDEAMGLRPSRLTWVCFACGAVGALGALWFQFWSSAVDWPINVGGKPFNSLPAFVPITFEAAILFGGLGVVAAMLLRCGLWPGKKPAQPDVAVTDDRFVLIVRSPGAVRDPAGLFRLLERFGALEIREELV